MSPIIEQPRGDDDFFSPEFIIFLCGAIPVISALYSFFGLTFVNAARMLQRRLLEGRP